MKILITGGAGCLGSNLVEHLLPQGHQILVLDNFVTGKREVVPEVNGMIVKEGSVEDLQFVDNCFSSFFPEIVVHAAASYKDPYDWQQDSLTNIQGSINVVRSAEKYGCNKLINFQTALCYGKPEKIPIPVEHPLSPSTSYGITKTAGEQCILQSKINTISLRIANVTGPRLSIGPIPTFYQRLRAGLPCFCSDTSRDFLDMADFLRLMDILLVKGGLSGVFNVSTGSAHTMKELFDIVAEHLNLGCIDVPIRPVELDDVSVVALDPKQTTEAFGWTPHLPFKETIVKQLKWYDLYGVSQIHSHLKAQHQ